MRTLLYSVLRFTAQLASITSTTAQQLDNAVYCALWRGDTLQYKWANQEFTLRPANYLGFGLTAPSTYIAGIHAAQVTHAITRPSSNRTFARLLALDLEHNNYPSNPLLAYRRGRGPHAGSLRTSTWRLSGLNTVLQRFRITTPQQLTYADVLSLPLHNNVLWYTRSIPPEIRYLADVFDHDTGNLLHHLAMPCVIGYGAYTEFTRGIPAAVRTYLSQYRRADPSTHTLFMPLPALSQVLTTATADDNINTSIRNCIAALDQANFAVSAPIPTNCLSNTNKWWKELPAGLRHWQFRYTIGAIPFNTRLHHLPAHRHQPPSFRLCRNCHAHDETLEHLFVTCAHATTRRTSWAALLPIPLTAAQKLQLWNGELGPWMPNDNTAKKLRDAANTALQHRRELERPP